MTDLRKTGLTFIVFVMMTLLTAPGLYAQEFNCDVTINDDQLEGSSYSYVTELETKLESYINEYRWTETEFREHERITCQIQIVLNSADQSFTYSAEGIFSAKRPIYATTSETTSIILSDDAWQFSYPQGKTLIHDELQFEALTGYIDYFCLMLLGYDFDSFADQGGDPYYARAQNIVNLAQNTNALGWTRTTNNRRNRYVMVNDLTSAGYQDLRTAYYQYHREGLDRFVSNPQQARRNILDALILIRDTKRKSTSNFLFDLFFDTKYREIAAIFEDAETDLRLEAYNVLQDTDQGHLSEYEGLQN